MYLITNEGIEKINKKPAILQLFCKHEKIVTGEKCFKNGATKISEQHLYAVCKEFGYIFSESHQIIG